MCIGIKIQFKVLDYVQDYLYFVLGGAPSENWIQI
jgi:hypothetical protein